MTATQEASWEERFEPVPASAGSARRFVERVLRRAGFAGDLDTVLLLVSEVASNAVRHARTPFELRVELHGEEVVVTVVDRSPRPVEPQIQRPDATGGRGLFIVSQLARAWGTEATRNGGKAVWFACT